MSSPRGQIQYLAALVLYCVLCYALVFLGFSEVQLDIQLDKGGN